MPPKSSAQRVVEDLRVELFRRRITQDRIAAAAGMSQSAVSRRLNGEVSPTVEELEALASAGGLTVQIAIAPPASDLGTTALATAGRP